MTLKTTRIDIRLLDLFCGAGGAAMGYYRAGIVNITGVDIAPQPRYPFDYIQGDALDYLEAHGHEYDIIHASPVCKGWTRASFHGREYPDLITPTRQLLQKLGKPYIIENVPGAPLENPLMLCGTMFGLNVIRHRLFECNPPIWFAPASCAHVKRITKTGRPVGGDSYITVVGHFSGVAQAQIAMGIDWMGQKGLAQAVPPAFTEYIGRRMLEKIMEVAT